MPIRTIVAAMLAGAIPAEKIDLTDDFAFTGALTLDGAGVATGAQTGIQRVAAASTANVANLNAAPNVLDGYSLQINDKILLKNQTSPAQNGIYEVTTVGTGANGVWARHADADDASELPKGLIVIVTNGDTNGGAMIMLQAFDGTLGSDDIVFSEFVEGLVPFAEENLVNVGTGDGANLAFDLPTAGTVQIVVIVGGVPQPSNIFSISAGGGTGGVDQLNFASGNAPPNGADVEVIGFTRG